MSDSPGESQTERDERAELEEQRDFLLASLDDLDREHDAGDLDDTDHRALRDDYTARAAAVLRALDDERQATSVAGHAEAPRRGVGRRVAVVLAVVAFAALAGVLVAQTSGTRKPGESASGAGAIPQTAATQAQACIALTEAALRSEQDLPTKGVDALRCYDKVLQSAPGNPVAHAYRGWTAALMARRLDGLLPTENVASLVTRATEDLDDARKAEPAYPDAIVFSAITKLWQGDVAGARQELAAFDALDLPASNPMSQLVGQLLRPQLSASAAPSPTTTAPSASSPSTTSVSPSPPPTAVPTS